MSAMTAGELKRPSLTISIKLEDETEQTIKWTYGLSQDLQRVLPDPASVVDVIMSDPVTRDYIIRRCMTPLKRMVTDTDKDLLAFEDCKLDDPDEVEKLVRWVAEHLLYFFAISAGGLKKIGEALKAATNPGLPDPSKTGSQD
ncbi:hypothetical protein [Sphingomonas jaspsi]|uniref:hypothetical protein n=1 Tax=Sphingomonas jaspsi TaxID=392409 RepID=UPI00055A028D|nr:hypothetical protein [Sphingomonas jaspsi]